MGSYSSTSFSLKIVLISIFILTTATAFNFFIPSVLNFIISDIPVIWSVILSWLKPPYLYVVINGIIITIAATSRFHHHYNHHQIQSQPLIQPPVQPEFDHLDLPPVGFVQEIVETVDSPAPVVVATDSVDKFVETNATWTSSPEMIQQEFISPEIIQSEFISPEIMQPEFISPVTEKPLVKSRFANNRKTTKSIHEGVKSLKVAKPKKHETLETTWKTITDGRHIPLTRHLRKSDTFENQRVELGEQGLEPKVADYNVMKKFETFKDRTNHLNHRVIGRLRKEGSPSQDELNRRVEAFIKKFNDEMRLQRQESIQRYMEMINRGAE